MSHDICFLVQYSTVIYNCALIYHDDVILTDVKQLFELNRAEKSLPDVEETLIVLSDWRSLFSMSIH